MRRIGAHASSAHEGIMDLGIRGRKALLTGASRGLAKAAALALARDGVEITILARTRETLERTADEIRALGVKVTAVAGDVTTADGRNAALAACPEPDILLTAPAGSSRAVSAPKHAPAGWGGSVPLIPRPI